MEHNSNSNLADDTAHGAKTTDAHSIGIVLKIPTEPGARHIGKYMPIQRVFLFKLNIKESALMCCNVCIY